MYTLVSLHNRCVWNFGNGNKNTRIQLMQKSWNKVS